MKYKVVIGRDQDGMFEAEVVIDQDENRVFVSECPALPGCISQGETPDEALANIKDAINCYIKSLHKHTEPFPHPTNEKVEEGDTKPPAPRITCKDCGTELRPEDPQCPSCGGRNRHLSLYEQGRTYEMAALTQRQKGFKKFRIKLKSGEKVARRTGRPAEEFDAYDKVRNLRCHIVAEQDQTGTWRLVHCHVGPLDPSSPVRDTGSEGTIPYEADLHTTKHVVVRRKEDPHLRVTVPSAPLGIGCIRALFSHADLEPRLFAEFLLLLWVNPR